ncbi:hypothetical protein GRS96_18690 [Rathayibacter sp. VKM Ac-2803]|uniref:hypothetical protein n=1 Tax=Rathayibacter sp. VKM Ac-2803 TaxID=2609256 RepID=UPI00135A9729|nr:hypothetical protein [Rathayibacter sp. VKM Ac-2803]MWV51303.1 hypothetical protein [Rathayibacter sp. VKM Ac-2803]
MKIEKRQRRTIGLIGTTVAALTLCACQYADDGIRVLKGVVAESGPLVRSLPASADDAALARAAAVHLADVDQSLVSRAKELAQDEDVLTIVSYTCNLSGLAQADPVDVVAALDVAVEGANGQDRLELVFNDAATTTATVKSETDGSGVMTNVAALSVAVFQEVYC